MLKRQMDSFLEQITNDTGTRKLAEWDGSLVTGNRQIDDHHRQTLDQVNTLFNQMMNGTGQQGAKAVVASLGSSLINHLQEEEQQMARLHYPGLTRHRQAHEAFATRFEQLQKSVSANDGQASADVLEFTADWVTHHILQHDQAYVDFLKSRNAA